MNIIPAPDLLDYKTPAVRHLAWMLTAPLLLCDACSFDPRRHASQTVFDTLSDWDRHPERQPVNLAALLPRRLGLYFERLYAILMADLLGWSILGQNLVIRDQNQTLGELDFLLRNPVSGIVEHHEIAVKFYLGMHGHSRETPLWYGPSDAQDRLDIKTARMLKQQCRLTERPETQALLATLGIDEAVTARAFMPGYLFYPLGTRPTPPDTVADQHLRGYWLPSDQLHTISTRTWVPLEKPHWLGPWMQTEAPDPQLRDQALAWVESRGYPRLFAALKPLPDGSGWAERSRYFVVPEFWPGFGPLAA